MGPGGGGPAGGGGAGVVRAWGRWGGVSAAAGAGLLAVLKSTTVEGPKGKAAAGGQLVVRREHSCYSLLYIFANLCRRRVRPGAMSTPEPSPAAKGTTNLKSPKASPAPTRASPRLVAKAGKSPNSAHDSAAKCRRDVARVSLGSTHTSSQLPQPRQPVALETPQRPRMVQTRRLLVLPSRWRRRFVHQRQQRKDSRSRRESLSSSTRRPSSSTGTSSEAR